MSQLDFGLIGNCQISALIDQNAQIVWSCLPRLDSDPIFDALLDCNEGGSWTIRPISFPGESQWEVSQEYLQNTNILKTKFKLGNDSEFHVIDFCPRYFVGSAYHRPAEIMRLIQPIRGAPLIQVLCRPRFQWGLDVPQAILRPPVIQYQGVQNSVYLHTNASLSYVAQETPYELRETQVFILSDSLSQRKDLRFEVMRDLERTQEGWISWVKNCNIPYEYQSQVIRSALALKLHLYEDTGAIIAATTTSIPESSGSGRNWDYRYCWLRDAYFVVSAFGRLGQFEEIERFIHYLQNLCANEPHGRLQPVYGIDGRKELFESEVPHLRGFRGNTPVRVGNAAYRMDQHDVYGEMVLALTPVFFDQRLDRGHRAVLFEQVKLLVSRAIESFPLSDAGIWEFRGEKQQFVFSKVMIWVAVERGLRIARILGDSECVRKWSTELEVIHAEILKEGWDEELGIFKQSYQRRDPDAANLILPLIGFLSYQDEKCLRMIDAYEKSLRVERGVFRYRSADDFGIPKTTFTVCSFWLVDALWSVGRRDEAKSLFESILQKTNHLGLLSEDMDPLSGELWGNFPQTYSHVGLISSAMRISRTWEEGLEKG